VRTLSWILAIACFLSFAARAQGQSDDVKQWSFSLSLGGTFVPQDQDIESATLTADRNDLHLEARYNYEDRNTGSIWIGPTFHVGENWTLDATPMFGAIFGNTSGIAPGWELTVSHRWLEIYSETEFVYNIKAAGANFYYNWSEIAIVPADRFQFGVAIERTKLYRTRLGVQRGLFFRVSVRRVELTAYVMNLVWESPTEQLTATIHF